jgi:hypothetical protein
MTRSGGDAACGSNSALMVLDGYVRVSQVHGRSDERFMSPVVQREQIERWAQLRGALLGHVFEELDESGGRRDRPLLMQAVERVERGEPDGLVVAYLSHFGRSHLRRPGDDRSHHESGRCLVLRAGGPGLLDRRKVTPPLASREPKAVLDATRRASDTGRPMSQENVEVSGALRTRRTAETSTRCWANSTPRWSGIQRL